MYKSLKTELNLRHKYMPEALEKRLQRPKPEANEPITPEKGAMISGTIRTGRHRKIQELAPELTEKREITSLKSEIRRLEDGIKLAEETGRTDKKKEMEAKLDAAQEKLAGLLSSKFAGQSVEDAESAKKYLAEAQETKPEEWEKSKKEIAEERAIKKETEKEEKLTKLQSQIEFLKKQIEKTKGGVEEKKMRLQMEALRDEVDELEGKPRIKKPEEEPFEAPDEDKLKKVRAKIAAKPAEEEKKEEAKPEEKPFTKTEEAWFGEGEKAGESREEFEKLEQTAKERSSTVLSPETLAKKKAEVKEARRKAAEAPMPEEPQAVKDARNNLDDAKKKLDNMGIDPNIVTGSWINRTQIKLQSKAGFFSKKAKEIDKLCDTYLKAKKEVEEMTGPTGDALKQKLHSMSSGGGKEHSGGGFFKRR